jgi:hypothetical protein
VTTQWNGDARMAEIRKAAAEGLLAAGVLFMNQVRQRVSVPNPPPYLNSSKPGEYPRLRTGAGQKALTMEPSTPDEVVASGFVRVGYVQGDHHLLILELGAKRLGLLRTLDDMRPQLAALATAAFK